MMFKKALTLLLILLMVSVGMPVPARAEESGSEGAIVKAEILLIYSDHPTAKEQADVEVIVKALTYLQHSVVYLPAKEAADILNHYDAVICYQLRGNQDDLMDKLSALGSKKVFIIGSGGVEEYIARRNFNITCAPVTDSVATLEYKFSEGNVFRSLLSIKNSILLKGQFAYEGGSITVEGDTAGLYSRLDDFVYTPCEDLSDSLMRESLARELALWLWPYKGEPLPRAQYIVLNEVYPFTPPQDLMEAVDYLINLKLPFVISVMPIFQNGDYPAMKHFCEILRYAQANGAVIIMHTPNALKAQEDLELFRKYLTIATEAYANYGVYPLGIQVPETYLFDVTGREILKRYSTVFCYNENVNSTFDINEKYNNIYNDGHFLIAPAVGLNQLGNSQIKVYSTAFYIDITEGMEAFKQHINACIQSNIPMKSLLDIDQVVYADNLYLYTKSGQVFFNNQKVSLNYKPFQYRKYDYRNNVFRRIATDLTGLNDKLVFIVVTSSIIFTIFIVIARVRNRRRFLVKKGGDHNDLG